jgi:aminoglycoside/choline kinase family phosphotransferase
MSAEREEAMRAFLKHAGWDGAVVTPLPGDASTRRYFRVAHGSRKAMLMDQPQHAETPAAHANATPEERRALGYNAVARLAGGDCTRFVAAAEYLRARGLSAPAIYAADPARGFVLLEDLGDDLFYDTIAAGRADERELYAAAADVLAKLHQSPAPALLAASTPLHAYDETAQLAEVDLLIDWFMPLALGREASAEERAEYHALWRNALDATRNTPPVFVHRDYHAQNLLWLPDRDGIARVGLLDFQDALAGSRAQDLMHLVEDARRDVSPGTAAATVQRYIETARRRDPAFDEAGFRAEMATIAAQRNARIVGIFARLHKRDGKPRYLDYLPRVWGYLNRDLEHPALAPLKAWYDRMIPLESRGRPRGS